MEPQVTTTEVAVVGGGPAGLMLSHLLSLQGVESVVVDDRTHAEIEGTVRAGILERDSVRLLVESGVSDAVLTEGDQHRGIDLAFGGNGHRIDFEELVGASVWLYPQTYGLPRPRRGPGPRRRRREVRRHRDAGRRPGRPPGRAVHRRRRRRAGGALPTTWWAPTARAAPAAGRCPRRSGASTSASTRSPGSASCARRRRAPPSWSTATPTAGSRSSASAPRRCSGCTSSATRTRTRTRGRDDRIWAELAGAGRGRTATRSRRDRSPRTSVLRFRSFVHEPMRHRQPAARRRRRAHRPAHGGQGPQPGAGRRPRPRRGARAGPAHGRRRRAGRVHRPRARAGVEGAALLLLDDHDAAPRAGRRGLRRPAPGGRARCRGRVAARPRPTSPRATRAGPPARAWSRARCSGRPRRATRGSASASGRRSRGRPTTRPKVGS